MILTNMHGLGEQVQKLFVILCFQIRVFLQMVQKHMIWGIRLSPLVFNRI